MKPCISGATMMQATIAEDIDACAAAGFRGLEVWITKLEKHIQEHDPEELQDRIRQSGVTLVAAGYQGGLLLSQGEHRRVHFDQFRDRLQLCERFAISTMLVAADFSQRSSAPEMERAIVSLRQAAQLAAGFRIRLALEFRGSDAFCSSVETATQLVEHTGEENLGICFDLFHYYKGSSKFEDLGRIPRHRLFFVQVADVAGVPRELMGDADRILPGDGEFQIAPILSELGRIGYDGWVSLEALNPIIWQAPATQIAEFGHAAMLRLLSRRANDETRR